MIELAWDERNQRTVPVVRCVECRQPIRDAGMAGVTWFMDDHRRVPFSDRPQFVHKGRCLDRREAARLPGTSFRWQEMSHFLLELGEVMHMNWGMAARLSGVELSEKAPATPAGEVGR